MNPTEITNEAREAAADEIFAWNERAGTRRSEPEGYHVQQLLNTATKELREQLVTSYAELERLRDIVGEEDAASINAVLGESRNPC